MRNSHATHAGAQWWEGVRVERDAYPLSFVSTDSKWVSGILPFSGVHLTKSGTDTRELVPSFARLGGALWLSHAANGGCGWRRSDCDSYVYASVLYLMRYQKSGKSSGTGGLMKRMTMAIGVMAAMGAASFGQAPVQWKPHDMNRPVPVA